MQLVRAPEFIQMTTLREAAQIPWKPWDHFDLRDCFSHRWTAHRISTKTWGRWRAFYDREHPDPLNIVCTTQLPVREAATAVIRAPFPDAPPFDSYSLARDRLQKEKENQQMHITAISFPARPHRQSSVGLPITRGRVDLVVTPKMVAVIRPVTRQAIDHI
jgi:hypothetical protein